jgi:Trk-type K+ transport system membrane component
VTDLERWTIVVGIGTVVLFVALILLLVLLQLAPKAMQQRVYAATARWNEMMLRLLDRGAYAFAVVMVVTIGLSLIGAVALLFVPR